MTRRAGAFQMARLGILGICGPKNTAARIPFNPGRADLAAGLRWDLVNSYLAVDLETASTERASACAIGWAVFEAGRLMENGATLIDPVLTDEDWWPPHQAR